MRVMATTTYDLEGAVIENNVLGVLGGRQVELEQNGVDRRVESLAKTSTNHRRT